MYLFIIYVCVKNTYLPLCFNTHYISIALDRI